MRNRLLDRASIALHVQHYYCFRQSYIIPEVQAEHGNFVHIENFGLQAGRAGPRAGRGNANSHEHRAEWEETRAKQAST
jgi:hypothetical protein